MASEPPLTEFTRRAPTIRMVAVAAGVSTATVSYVLNDTPGQTISRRTRARVHAAADELAYRLPQRLPTGGSPVVVNVGADPIGPSMSTLVHSMREELSAAGRSLVITVEPDGVSREMRETLGPRAVLDLGRAGQSPAAAPWGTFRGSATGYEYHARIQMQHLVDAGHRRIALATQHGADAVFPRVVAHYIQGTATRLGLRRLREIDCGHPADAAKIRDEISAAAGDGVTAVAAVRDEIALAVLAGADGLGLRVPDDLAVIGFDDANAEWWNPRLTSIRIDHAAYGRRAAGLVLDRDLSAWPDPPSTVVARGSV